TAAKITSYTMTKLSNNEPVDLQIMVNICKIFHCDIGDLMEVIEE
ncbi:MAG: helix-turn-helix transcriptional regulator, partial [Ruminiclostridium sp.]|nr:helix-turn-helix transcriptional regulator [Ruminiclostridium sp.]